MKYSDEDQKKSGSRAWNRRKNWFGKQRLPINAGSPGGPHETKREDLRKKQEEDISEEELADWLRYDPHPRDDDPGDGGE